MICKAFTGYSINGVAMIVTDWLQENEVVPVCSSHSFNSSNKTWTVLVFYK